VYLERGFFFSWHPQGSGLRHALSSLPSGDTCSHDVTLLIAPSARFQGIPQASQRAMFTRNSRCSPATCTGKSPVTSLAHRTCAVSRAGQHERIVPGTRSARSANRTRGKQHVELLTRARMGTPVCRIQTTLTAILTVRTTVSFETRDVPAPESLHEDARVRAVREMPNRPRRWRLAEPARLPK